MNRWHLAPGICIFRSGLPLTNLNLPSFSQITTASPSGICVDHRGGIKFNRIPSLPILTLRSIISEPPTEDLPCAWSRSGHLHLYDYFLRRPLLNYFLPRKETLEVLYTTFVPRRRPKTMSTLPGRPKMWSTSDLREESWVVGNAQGRNWSGSRKSGLSNRYTRPVTRRYWTLCECRTADNV